MLAMTISAMILFLVSRLLTGCNVYSHFGYGRFAASQLDAASVTPLELAANVPFINPRFRPGLAWSS